MHNRLKFWPAEKNKLVLYFSYAVLWRNFGSERRTVYTRFNVEKHCVTNAISNHIIATSIGQKFVSLRDTALAPFV